MSGIDFFSFLATLRAPEPFLPPQNTPKKNALKVQWPAQRHLHSFESVPGAKGIVLPATLVRYLLAVWQGNAGCSDCWPLVAHETNIAPEEGYPPVPETDSAIWAMNTSRLKHASFLLNSFEYYV